MLDAGKPFAKNFRETIGRLFRRLFRVYAHLYSNHFDHICALGIEGTLAKIRELVKAGKL